ncbi:hypothetical protein ACGF0J_01340 [Nonomuraea sp. NPDC047897]|uniref:hypothetical protein n=1 Tax=Nonomuraea sp. NPDC047897 TaxID=3364346 RepID=UPI003715E96F
MPDFKDTGTTMYVTALGLTAYSAMAFGPLARIATAIIGTLYSSPSDIQDASNAWRRIVSKLDAFQAKLDALEKDVPEEDWKEMSRPEYQQVKKDFLARKDDSKPVYTGVADVLGGLSSLSQAAAVFSLAGASGMAMWATIVYLTRWNAALAAGGQATGNMYVQAFTGGLKLLAMQQRKAMLISASVTMTAGALLASMKAEELTKQATPETAPDYTQVYLEGLPQPDVPGSSSGLPRSSPSSTPSTAETTTEAPDTTAQEPEKTETSDKTTQAPGPTDQAPGGTTGGPGAAAT